jgi:hypothetical protein
MVGIVLGFNHIFNALPEALPGKASLNFSEFDSGLGQRWPHFPLQDNYLRNMHLLTFCINLIPEFQEPVFPPPPQPEEKTGMRPLALLFTA